MVASVIKKGCFPKHAPIRRLRVNPPTDINRNLTLTLLGPPCPLCYVRIALFLMSLREDCELYRVKFVLCAFHMT